MVPITFYLTATIRTVPVYVLEPRPNSIQPKCIIYGASIVLVSKLHHGLFYYLRYISGAPVAGLHFLVVLGKLLQQNDRIKF